MKVDIPAGNYVVAVSGGVDSMVMLDIIRRKPDVTLVVAHFNHGIREDSVQDEKLVEETAKKYSLKYEVGHGNLPAGASEDTARKARYKFLEAVQDKYSADGIITAHHQDDLIETVFMNLLRGSGYRGLVSIKTNKKVMRPLLNVTKQELIKYAERNKLVWREDTTNDDESYMRNYIRKNLTSQLNAEDYKNIISATDKIADTVAEREKLIATISHYVIDNDHIARSRYNGLPLVVRYELIVHWLRGYGTKDYDKKNVEKVDIYLKTGLAGSSYPIKKGLWLTLQVNRAQFKLRT
jgi:tRNA(Ile)-lysidine synthase